MTLTGRLLSFWRDPVTQQYHITLGVNEDPTGLLRELQGREIDIGLKKHREKRSLDANAYYWTLVTKLAKALEISNQETHNLELQKYGELDRIDGELIAVQLPDTDETLKNVREKAEYHLVPTSKVVSGKNRLNRVYLMMRGSSTYDTVEMARLIKGLISDCKSAEIPESEIMTPFEKKKLEEQYGIKMDAREEAENPAIAVR